MRHRALQPRAQGCRRGVPLFVVVQRLEVCLGFGECVPAPSAWESSSDPVADGEQQGKGQPRRSVRRAGKQLRASVRWCALCPPWWFRTMRRSVLGHGLTPARAEDCLPVYSRLHHRRGAHVLGVGVYQLFRTGRLVRVLSLRRIERAVLTPPCVEAYELHAGSVCEASRPSN